MFQIRHSITLVNGEHFSLFGEDYFGDKKVFWEAHQSQLNALLNRVQEVGAPIVVVEYPQEANLTFETVDLFKQWLSKHHPVIQE